MEQIRHAFHESFVAAFSDTLRLNVILPIAIAILAIMLLPGKKEGNGGYAEQESGRVSGQSPDQARHLSTGVGAGSMYGNCLRNSQ